MPSFCPRSLKPCLKTYCWLPIQHRHHPDVESSQSRLSATALTLGMHSIPLYTKLIPAADRGIVPRNDRGSEPCHSPERSNLTGRQVAVAFLQLLDDLDPLRALGFALAVSQDGPGAGRCRSFKIVPLWVDD